MKKYILILGIVLLCISACRRYQPAHYRGLPLQYTSAYQQTYGHCYDSLPEVAVVALDLYSEGLDLDKNNVIRGTGYNLYISDIFVPDSLLVTGEYKSETTAEAFTFLPGKDYEGTPHGMYILNIEKDKVIQIQVLDSGSFAYRNDSLIFTLYYRNAYGGKATYQCSFTGSLLPWQKK